MRWVAGMVGCLLLSVASLLAEQAPAAKSPSVSETTATIKTSSRIVLLDVLVTNKTGRPVRGLRAQDFTVLEDGKPQQIRGFEERYPDVVAAAQPAPLNLPPNTYTNFLTARAPGAINILLFDTLNTDRRNLTTARQQLLQYLGKLPDNSRVALFTLDSELHLVHGFTDDPHELIESARKLSSFPHPMNSNARDVS